MEEYFALTGYESTPHARGSTHLLFTRQARRLVYPACAGIHLSQLTNFINDCSLPRMRGDPPFLVVLG